MSFAGFSAEVFRRLHQAVRKGWLSRLGPLLAVGCCSWFSVAARPAAADTLDFDRDVRPILAERCLKCHGGDEPEASLSFTSREAALAEAASGQRAIVPGDPEASELVRRIQTSEPSERMPPEGEKPLTEAEAAQLVRWIREGAPWQVHWSLRWPVAAKPPAVRDESWVATPLDRFVLARLQAESLSPAPEADRATLIKRLYYDLLGLPPAPADVEAFLSDSAPDAYSRLVDRLLASPHFGERWGRHWLDLAHYADSDGYEKDRARDDAYLYRDWVIQSLNRDQPFDQFTIEQLAGDLLPEATTDQQVATAFLRQTLTNEEGGVDQEEFRVAACFDRTDTVGTVWLGLTVGCARCHDHKYDPLSQVDYYRLFAFFNQSDETNRLLPAELPNRSSLDLQLAPIDAALEARQRELADAERAWEVEARARLLAQSESPLAEHPLEIRDVQREHADDVEARIEGNTIALLPTADRPAPDKQTLTVTAAWSEPAAEGEGTSRRLTGLKLSVLPDDGLPGQGPGRAENGNFVLSQLLLVLVRADGSERTIALHRAEADYAQGGFSADRVLRDSESGKPSGWAVGGKLGAAHWLRVRTREPLEVAPGDSLRITLRQQYGQRHTLGKFQLAALSGDERGLEYSEREIAAALEMYPEKRVARTREQLFQHYLTQVAADERWLALARQRRELVKASQSRWTTVRTMARPRLARTTQVFHRGDFLSPTDGVSPGPPARLGEFRARGDQADRLDLARWLVSGDCPLTSRVAVNHVWLHLFGAPLVETTSDFGVRGAAPSHPELLDWLASQFQGPLGWSRKELIRLVVLSSAYRQSSRFRPELAERDPANRLLARQNRFRVEAEIVRDLSLAVSGLLSARVGGPSVFPPMPDELAKLSYANNFSWRGSEGSDRYRRGMYTFLKRTILYPSLTTFDAPDTNVACTMRTVSNTPLQALVLLNNEVHAEAARALAHRLQTSPGSDKQRLGRGLQWVLLRQPKESEVATLQTALQGAREHYREHRSDAAALCAVPTAEAETAPHLEEQAAWVAVARVLLNLDEFLTRE